jgi:hypothetical protein
MEHNMKNFWWNWLVWVTVATMLFGLSMIILPDAVQRLFNLVAFQNRGIEELLSAEAIHYIRFVYGVLGAVIFGWMLSFLPILFGAYRRGEKEGYLAISLSIGVWFIVDSSWSGYMGFWGNVALNTILFILFAIPLAASYRGVWE